MPSPITTSPTASSPALHKTPTIAAYKWAAMQRLPKIPPASLEALVNYCDQETLKLNGGMPAIGLHKEIASKVGVSIIVSRLVLGAAMYRRVKFRNPTGLNPAQVAIARAALKAQGVAIPISWVEPSPKPGTWRPRELKRESGPWARLEWRPRCMPGGDKIDNRARGPWRRGSQPECACGDAFDLDDRERMSPPRPPRIKCVECKSEVQVREVAP